MEPRLSPAPPPKYLDRPYPSTQKGGTLIVAEVVDVATHLGRLCRPDGYRPVQCPRCGHRVLHVHDYRRRVLRADPAGAVLTVVRYRCVAPDCGARWLLLPRLLARRLWRRWAVVAAATVERRPPAWPRVPARTRRRWQERLGQGGRLLVQLLASSGQPLLSAVAARLGLTPSRRQLVTALAWPMAAVAALLHQLAPGVRLM